jgi:RimJ/RimL family protein N-acetyltransferase
MPFLDLDATRAQLARFRAGWEAERHSHWAVEELATGRLVGRIGILRHHDWPLAPAVPEVGWSLDPAVWGSGLATEGGRASIAVWREHLADDARLLSITTPDNGAPRRVMEKLGLTPRGEGDWRGYHMVWYALDR